MRRTVALVTLAVLCTAGCHFSHVNAQATVTVTGRALDASGRPLAAAQVRLFKEADVGEALLGSVLAVGTLGLVCLLPNAPQPCNSSHVTTTDATGTYSFELKGSDTQGLIGETDTLDVVVTSPGSGADAPSTVVRFTVNSTSVQLPDARLWNAAPKLSQTSAQIRLAWSALPAADGHSVSYSAQLYDTQQRTLWSQSAGAGGAAIDARLLEDQKGAAAPSAYATLSGSTGTGTVHASYLAARLPVRPTAGAPPSRNRACSAVTGTTTLPTTPQRACQVTNGDLFAVARLAATDAQIVSGVVVDLGAARHIHLIVARGLAGQFVVEISTNGSQYQQLSTELGSAIAFAPPGAPVARYVRLRSPSGLDESLMGQVSVW